MREHFECPVCGEKRWESIRSYKYSAGDGGDAGILDSYTSVRRRILFELWAPGAANITLNSIMCLECGFMAYTPRPTEQDIDDKYRLLQVDERNIGGQKDDPKLRALDNKRGAAIFKLVSRFVTDDAFDVLDFGGGDGKLLGAFLENGHLCGLVDYNVQPLEGVTKIGDTLDEIPQGRLFDVIIASHIIEHLVEPGQTVKRLSGFLRGGGVIYGEVPLGIWKGIGIELDPVTHINFFMKYSFRRMFEEQGLEVLHCRQRVGAYNRRNDVVEVVAKKSDALPKSRKKAGPAEARRLLDPSPAEQISRRLRLRRYPPLGELFRRVGLKPKR